VIGAALTLVLIIAASVSIRLIGKRKNKTSPTHKG
jgi:hypothetical protein